MIKHRFTYSKTIIISLLILLLCVSNMCQALAGGLKFTDIKASKYDWARPYIEKMYHLGIVKGVTETSYAPDASVKRDEIITMMIRLMDLENEAKGKKLPTTFPKANTVPPWAIPYVAEAIDKNIITGKDFKDFRAEDAALRWEVAVFAVKALGLGDEAERRKNLNLTFSDTYAIPLDARTYVDIAVEKGIVKGYPDNSFKPNNKITRAQAATLLNNMIRHIAVKDIVKGEVRDVDTVLLPSIEIKLPSGSYATYSIGKATSVYQEDEKGALVESSLDKKDIGSYVTILVEENNKNTAAYIEKSSTSTSTPVTDTTPDSSYIKGIIKNINRANNTLTVFKENGDNVVLTIKGDTKTYVDGVSATLSDLAVGQSVKISVSGTSIIDIKAQNAREQVKGTFVGLNFASENPEMTIQSLGKEYKYQTDKYVYVRKNGRSAELKDLRPGDDLEAELEYGKIVRVIATSTIKDVNGTIKALAISDKSAITVTDDDGKDHTIYVTPDTEISQDRKESDLYHLRVGYYIDAEVEGNEAIYIDVTTRKVQETLQGIVQNVHRELNVLVIKIKKPDGVWETKQIHYTDETRITRGYDGNDISIRRINEGDKIFVAGEYDRGIFRADSIVNLTITE